MPKSEKDRNEKEQTLPCIIRWLPLAPPPHPTPPTSPPQKGTRAFRLCVLAHYCTCVRHPPSSHPPFLPLLALPVVTCHCHSKSDVSSSHGAKRLTSFRPLQQQRKLPLPNTPAFSSTILCLIQLLPPPPLGCVCPVAVLPAFLSLDTCADICDSRRGCSEGDPDRQAAGWQGDKVAGVRNLHPSAPLPPSLPHTGTDRTVSPDPAAPVAVAAAVAVAAPAAATLDLQVWNIAPPRGDDSAPILASPVEGTFECSACHKVLSYGSFSGYQVCPPPPPTSFHPHPRPRPVEPLSTYNHFSGTMRFPTRGGAGAVWRFCSAEGRTTNGDAKRQVCLRSIRRFFN